ncbi:MAG: DUF6878 family protein [Methylocystis sp.]|uniref:DUF6878 family protein n=1 Tax=Methylocystis sp. TaxID=1911079 RepID=UPI003DA3F086
MSDTQSTPVPSLDFTALDQKNREHARIADELLLANKTALFDALAAAAIDIVTVVFDGYGDSGQIENIEAKAGDEIIALPTCEIEMARPVCGSSEIERQTQPVREAIETLAYDFLGETQSGWGNDEGAYGDFTFDVAARTITLDYNERHMESDYSQHVF